MTTTEWDGGAAQGLLDHAARLHDLLKQKTCGDCGEPIVFVKTNGGKYLPVDIAKLDSAPREFIIDARSSVFVTPAVMRHVCPEQPKVVERKTFHKVADILAAHPDLEPIYEATRDAVRGEVLDRSKIADAKAKWLEALEERGIDFQPMSASLGFPRLNDPDLEQRIGGVEKEPEFGHHSMIEQNRAVI